MSDCALAVGSNGVVEGLTISAPQTDVLFLMHVFPTAGIGVFELHYRRFICSLWIQWF